MNGYTYIVRIYYGERDKPESWMGIVEDVQRKEEKRFVGLEELGKVFASFHESEELLKDKTLFKKEEDKRRGPRINIQIPILFVGRKSKSKGTILNYSPHGLGLAVNAKAGLRIGSLLNIESGESSAKAEIRWVDRKTSSAELFAGCRIISGQCTLDSLKTNAAIMVKAVKT